ncbi:MAG TPA: hypothetical protein VFV52_07030 [Bacilli bacterium]|nr:hypothetical protein [Bacilli bacterium]
MAITCEVCGAKHSEEGDAQPFEVFMGGLHICENCRKDRIIVDPFNVLEDRRGE